MVHPGVARRALGVRLIVHTWMCAVVVRVLKHVLPLPRLVRLLRRGVWIRHRPQRVLVLRSLATVGPALPLRLPANCLDRSLALFRLLVAAGAAPRLVVGVRSDGRTRVGGHVWIQLDGEALGETAADQSPFEELLAFDHCGRSLTASGPPADGPRP